MPEKPDPSQLLDQFVSSVTDAAVSTGLAQVGLRMVAGSVQQDPVHPENPDPQVFVGSGPPTSATGVLGWWRRSYLATQTVIDGPVDRYLVQAFIVFTFSRWEGEFRPALQSIMGKTIESDVFGDLRLMRNDIVHHRGRATANNTGRCINSQWRFSPGTEIFLNSAEFAGLVDAIQAGIALLREGYQEPT